MVRQDQWRATSACRQYQSQFAQPQDALAQPGALITGGSVYLSREYIAEFDSHGDERGRILRTMAERSGPNLEFAIHWIRADKSQ